MRILDLRPRTVRFMSSLWRKGAPVRGCLAKRPDSRNPFTNLMGKVTDNVVARRVAARKPAAGGPAIVSVGNLALGGTGKTPVVTALARDLADDRWRGAVLTRGFGSPLSGPLAVDPGNVLAGDEARLMAAALDPCQWPVIQARHRARGLEYLVEEHPGIEIVIVEDGHQTARLGRHLDVVILDAWTVDDVQGSPRIHPVTGAVFPFGPWRESSAGAERAGIWLLETEEPVPAEGMNGQAVAAFSRHLSLRDAQEGSLFETPDGRFAVLSGIARPAAFEKALEQVLVHEPVLSIRFGDHADYTPRDAADIRREVEEAGADFLVTTAKDWVKLEPFWSNGPRVLLADLEIRWGGESTLPELVAERLGALRARPSGHSTREQLESGNRFADGD
ncbi:MAG: tetraacyldisaccharide 4'-kinase [Candidatus Krumholzibacteriota bacterium]